MAKITVYQVRDNGAKVKITFDAEEEENIYTSNVTNVPKNLVGKIQHWSNHSELIVVGEQEVDQVLENLVIAREKESHALKLNVSVV